MNLPESVTVMILARLPAGVITRLKLVCREWKSLFESCYFRDLYKTINQRNLSSPWSILFKEKPSNTYSEFVSERWGFTQSIDSCISRFLDEMKAANKSLPVTALAITDGLILLCVWTTSSWIYRVADPVLRQWINIPKPPLYYFGTAFKGTTLVTHMNNDDLLGYKVVWYKLSKNGIFYFQIYSSDSGNWIQHNVTTPFIFHPYPANPINLNGCLHWLCRANQVIFVHDFYASTEFSCVINLPQHSEKSSIQPEGQATLTISCGSLMYMNTDTGRPNQQLEIWRLKNYKSGSSKDSWEFLWNLDLFVGCIPVAMHPFDKEVVYLVTRRANCFQSRGYLAIGNLRTKKFQLHKEWKQVLIEYEDYKPRFFHQFVHPQRLGSIPCPRGCTLVAFPENPEQHSC